MCWILKLCAGDFRASARAAGSPRSRDQGRTELAWIRHRRPRLGAPPAGPSRTCPTGERATTWPVCRCGSHHTARARWPLSPRCSRVDNPSPLSSFGSAWCPSRRSCFHVATSIWLPAMPSRLAQKGRLARSGGSRPDGDPGAGASNGDLGVKDRNPRRGLSRRVPNPESGRPQGNDQRTSALSSCPGLLLFDRWGCLVRAVRAAPFVDVLCQPGRIRGR